MANSGEKVTFNQMTNVKSLTESCQKINLRRAYLRGAYALYLVESKKGSHLVSHKSTSHSREEYVGATEWQRGKLLVLMSTIPF